MSIGLAATPFGGRMSVGIAAPINDLLLLRRDLWPGGLDKHQYSTLNLIAQCRTGALGHIEARCWNCGYQELIGSSCGNRHCPLCSGFKQVEWARQVCERLPDVPHFHVVFTVPKEVRELIKCNYAILVSALFRAASRTLHRFFANNLKLLGGFLAVLHTWGSNLIWHPHLHVLVSGGGFNVKKGKWRRCRKTFLFPVKALSKVYRKIMLEALEALEEGNQTMEWPEGWQSQGERKLARAKLKQRSWVIYAKSTLGNTKAAVRYLARYTNRIAISNRRIVECDLQAETIQFQYKDYRDKVGAGGRKKGRKDYKKPRILTMTLSLTAFIRRFAQHIVPPGVRRIRYYGFLSPGRGQPDYAPLSAKTKEGQEQRPKCPKCQSPAWTSKRIPARIEGELAMETIQGVSTRWPQASYSSSLIKVRARASPRLSSNKALEPTSITPSRRAAGPVTGILLASRRPRARTLAGPRFLLGGST
jgi:hypothetical protein